MCKKYANIQQEKYANIQQGNQAHCVLTVLIDNSGEYTVCALAATPTALTAGPACHHLIEDLRIGAPEETASPRATLGRQLARRTASPRNPRPGSHARQQIADDAIGSIP
jgi:hypothetical protein